MYQADGPRTIHLSWFLQAYYEVLFYYVFPAEIIIGLKLKEIKWAIYSLRQRKLI